MSTYFIVKGMNEAKTKVRVCSMCHLLAKVLEDFSKQQILKLQILMRTWK